jgi:hypothetical protein
MRSQSVIAIAAIVSFAIPAVGSAESLKATVGAEPRAERPVSITVTGTADGSHRLFALVEPWGAECPDLPLGEPRLVWLGPREGEPLTAGDFTASYSFIPPAGGIYPLCLYLDASRESPPDVHEFATIDVRVTSSYLGNAAESLRPIALEDEQKHLKETEERHREQEKREQHPASELAQGQANQRVPEPASASCIVPNLTGRTINGARAALVRAHCRLGRVKKPTGTHRGKLVVLHQSPRRGTDLPTGTAVAVTLHLVK